MINSLCGSLKSENNSRSKLQAISSNDQSVVQSTKKNATKSAGDLDTSLTPPSLNLSALKFELDGDVEVQSPDSTMWESFFADQLDTDFMISSPVRNVLSPQASSYNCQYNSYGEGGQNILSGCSQVIGACQKGKGLSPLHRVLNNAPNNNQYMHVENLSLPATEELLEEYKGCSSSKDHIASSSECFDLYNQIPPSMLDSYPLPSCEESSEMYEYEQQVGSMSQDSGLEMVHLLLACAEAVAKEEHMLARRYIQQLKRVVRPLGDSMQRVAACFTDSLSARINSTPSPTPSNSLEVLKVYQIVYQACPYVKFAHFTANQAIFEAMENEERVHVIDLDILQGYQWPAFMQALAARPGGAPFLRITGVGPSLDHVRQTGRCLTDLAHSLRIPFEFHALGQQLEDLTQSMLNRRVGEALAVNAVNRLHHVPGSHLGHLLSMIRDQAPNIVTLVEQEAGHNGPYFLGRFLEALHYYSAIFDSLDATFPPESPQRAKVEQYIFAPEIMNIVACEGAQRFERHERLEKWRKIMEGKGFTGVPLSPNALTQSKILLGLYSSDGYRLTQDKGCLLLGWQDRPIVAASAWRC